MTEIPVRGHVREGYPVRPYVRSNSEQNYAYTPRMSGRFLEAAYDYYRAIPEQRRALLAKDLSGYAAHPTPIPEWNYGNISAVRGNDPRWDGSPNPEDLHVTSSTTYPAITDEYTFRLVMRTLMWVEHNKYVGNTRARGASAPLFYLSARMAGRTPEEAYRLR